MRSLIAVLALIAATVAVQEPGIPVVVHTMMALGPLDSAELRAAFEAGLAADSLVRVVHRPSTSGEASSQARLEPAVYMISIGVLPGSDGLRIRLRSVVVATAKVCILDSAWLPLGVGRDSVAREAGRRFAARLAGKAP